jgi:hypothetical protein
MYNVYIIFQVACTSATMVKKGIASLDGVYVSVEEEALAQGIDSITWVAVAKGRSVIEAIILF